MIYFIYSLRIIFVDIYYLFLIFPSLLLAIFLLAKIIYLAVILE